MKIIYFNDTSLPKTVYQYNLYTENLIGVVEPQGQIIFEIPVPEEDKALFVKEWANLVMFSYTST
jgi:hypothetical protein